MPREEIDTTPGKPGGSRYIRRDKDGQFTNDQVSAGRSVAADKRVDAEHDAKKGDHERRPARRRASSLSSTRFRI